VKAKLLALILVMAATGVAQTSIPVHKPLDRVQVLALLAGGVTSKRVATLVEQRGIDFEPTEDYLKILQGAGAEEALLNGLREARRIPTPAIAAPGLSRQQEVEQHLGRGAEFAKQKLYVEAKQEYETAVRLDPLNASVHSALAEAFFDLEDWDGAISEYQNAIRLEPDGEWPYIGLGMAYERKPDLDGAINAYQSAIKLGPDDVLALAHNSLGDVRYRKGDVDGAIREYREAIRISEAQGANILTEFQKMGLEPKSDASHGIYMFLVGDPQAHAYANLGVALDSKGDSNGAIAEYKSALQLKPDDAVTHANLGLALEKKGDLAGAIAELRRAKRLKPHDPWAIANLGIALEKKGDVDGAIAEYQESLQLDQNDVGRHVLLASALNKKGDLQGALDEWRKAYLLNPKDPRIRSAYEEVLREVNRR
jgi:tetratricopeptide (TPR) repeat protein